MAEATAFLSEIFSSIQGEGIFMGYRQLFIRFAGCNLGCQYCDTPTGLPTKDNFRVESIPATNKFKYFKNPVSTSELINIITKFGKFKNSHHSVALTGGEPLEQVDFLKELLPKLKEKNFKTYLETNGILYKELKEIIGLIDIVAMDVKLPSSSGLKECWDKHQKFMEVAILKKVFVKAIIVSDTTKKEMELLGNLISKIDNKIPLILQPVTPNNSNLKPPSAKAMFTYQEICKEKLEDVRILPQVHRFMGWL